MVHQHTSKLHDDAWKYCSYLSFKMDCAREQEEVRWSFLREKAQGHFNELAVAQEAKTVELAKAMPKKALTRVVSMPKVMMTKAVTKVVHKPSVMFKVDGLISSQGVKWLDLCKSHKVDKGVSSITVQVSPEKLSANAHKWYHLLKSENMPKDTVGPITVVTGYEDGNPNGHAQVKQWLYALGWVP